MSDDEFEDQVMKLADYFNYCLRMEAQFKDINAKKRWRLRRIKAARKFKELTNVSR